VNFRALVRRIVDRVKGNAMSQPVLAYSSEVALPGWTRRLMRPLGWVYFAALAGVAGWVMWVYRLPAPLRSEYMTLAIAAVAVVGMVRLLLQMLLLRIYGQPWAGFWRGLWRYGVPVVVAGTLAALIWGHVPERVAWRLSEPALRRYVQGIIAAETVTTRPFRVAGHPSVWIGAYQLESVEHYPGPLVVFLVDDKDGFVYCADGTVLTPRYPIMAQGVSYTPMEGNWYRVKVRAWEWK
jgi:hypothetical protein